MCSVQGKNYNIQSTVYSLQYTVSTVEFTVLSRAVYVLLVTAGGLKSFVTLQKEPGNSKVLVTALELYTGGQE